MDKSDVIAARSRYEDAIHQFLEVSLTGDGRAIDEARNKVHDTLDLWLDILADIVRRAERK